MIRTIYGRVNSSSNEASARVLLNKTEGEIFTDNVRVHPQSEGGGGGGGEALNVPLEKNPLLV